MSALQQRAEDFSSFARIVMVPGHEEMWFAIRDIPKFRSGFTAADLARVSGAKVGAVEFYLAKLARQGRAERVGTTDDKQPVYAVLRVGVEPVVLDDSGQPSHDYTRRHALWNAMRILKTFTIKQLWINVRDENPLTQAMAAKYVKRLHAADYLDVIEVDLRTVEDHYHLRPTMNTGRRPPRLCEAELIFDPNTQSFHGTAEAREVRLDAREARQ